MKDNAINSAKTNLIRRYSLSICKIACRQVAMTGLKHFDEDSAIFHDIGGNPLLEEVQSFIRDMQSLDPDTARAVLKRFL